jgi:hypothetical protein
MPRPKERVLASDTKEWQYLFDASLATLQSFECTRLNHAETLFEQMAILANKHASELAAAALARAVLQSRPYVSRPVEILSPNLAPTRIITQSPKFCSPPHNRANAHTPEPLPPHPATETLSFPPPLSAEMLDHPRELRLPSSQP